LEVPTASAVFLLPTINLLLLNNKGPFWGGTRALKLKCFAALPFIEKRCLNLAWGWLNPST